MKKKAIGFVLTSLAGVMLATSAFAQNQAPPAGGGGGFGGGGGGGRGRLPFAMGSVSSVDPNAGTVTITPQFGGQGPQVINVPQGTQIMTQTTATVADLKVGDQVQVNGVPTGITASDITDGVVTTPYPGGGGGRGGGAAGGVGGRRGGGGGGAAGPAVAQATGHITALSPLTISLSNQVSIVLTVSSTTKLSKITTLPISSIKVGDRIMASGTANQDGSFSATTVGVNMNATMGGGGFGGGFGGGGGGFGGGGRRRGGGGGGGFGGGGGGANPGTPPPADDGGGLG